MRTIWSSAHLWKLGIQESQVYILIPKKWSLNPAERDGLFDSPVISHSFAIWLEALLPFSNALFIKLSLNSCPTYYQYYLYLAPAHGSEPPRRAPLSISSRIDGMFFEFVLRINRNKVLVSPDIIIIWQWVSLSSSLGIFPRTFFVPKLLGAVLVWYLLKNS